MLVAQGWTILGTNVRIGRLEVDVLARKGAVVAVVEVRTRGAGSWQSAFASIDGAKRRRLRSAAEALWKRFAGDPTVDRIRVDAAAVDLSSSPVVVEIAEAIA